jgi:hypothetical protein
MPQLHFKLNATKTLRNALADFYAELRPRGVDFPVSDPDTGERHTLAWVETSDGLAHVDMALIEHLMGDPGTFAPDGTQLTPPTDRGPHVDLLITGVGADALVKTIRDHFETGTLKNQDTPAAMRALYKVKVAAAGPATDRRLPQVRDRGGVVMLTETPKERKNGFSGVFE